jgi:hypothetical protein
VCSTFDDGQVEVSFDARGKPQTAPLPNATALGPVLAVLRNPATLKPSATVHARAIAVTQPTATVFNLTATSAPAMTKVVALSVDALVGQQNNRLVFWDISGKNVALDATITAGTGWQSIGFDATSFYLYRNSGSSATAATSTWKVVKVSRQAPVATLLASGAGYIASTSMGLTSLFITSLSVNGASLSRLAKAAPGVPVVFQGPFSTEVPSSIALSGGVQLISNTPASTTALVNTVISVQEEDTGKTLFSNANAFPAQFVQNTTFALNNSVEIAAAIILGDGSATAVHLGATLISYDAASRTQTVVGRLPSAAEFGFATGLASISGTGANGFGTGTLSALTAGNIPASPRRLFSFDRNVADSIQYTTAVK